MTYLSRYIFILFMLLLSTAFSCNSGNSRSNKEKSSGDNFNMFFPVSDAGKWVYINEAPREETVIYTVQVKDVKKGDDGIQFKVTSFPFLTQSNEERTLKIHNNGEVEINDYMGSSGIIFPKAGDMKKGYKWSFGIFTGYVNSERETATTEAGTYDNCVYVSITDGFTFSYEMWFKEDAGIVKWGANRTNPPQLKRIYYVLKEIELK